MWRNRQKLPDECKSKKIIDHTPQRQLILKSERNYIQFVSIDPGQENFCMRIERRYYNNDLKRMEIVLLYWKRIKISDHNEKIYSALYDVLNNQVNTFEDKSNEFDVQIKVLKEKNDDLLAHTKTLEEQLKFKHVVINTHVDRNNA